MLQRDYIMRLIQEFMVAIQKFLEKAEGEDQDLALRDLYRQYVGDYDTLRNLSVDEALHYAGEHWKDDEQTERLGMLAELYYVEGSGKQAPLRDMLLEKAFHLFDYVDAHDTTFNLDRQQKMVHIQQMLHAKSH
ncbi:hypothetical protein [Hoylesella enoeca]|uniref:hypothetical protein n=1 Tax=Hoylesella enoeca TaxID=76123 RepID=UPI00288AB41A|nr:hypothetical protein [Hoylesella enoeca]